ncbi:MAG: hypothetical protein QXQ57_04990 [Sulfolobales archaeon]
MLEEGQRPDNILGNGKYSIMGGKAVLGLINTPNINYIIKLIISDPLSILEDGILLNGRFRAYILGSYLA